MRGSQGIGSGPSSSKIEDEPSPLHFRLRTASPRQVAAPRNEDDLAARNAETRAQLGTAPERGCGEAQPQHVQISNRFRHSTAPGEAKLLRLVSATQPRSVFGAVCGCARDAEIRGVFEKQTSRHQVNSLCQPLRALAISASPRSNERLARHRKRTIVIEDRGRAVSVTLPSSHCFAETSRRAKERGRFSRKERRDAGATWHCPGARLWRSPAAARPNIEPFPSFYCARRGEAAAAGLRDTAALRFWGSVRMRPRRRDSRSF
jgi:hypothetical protein